MIEKVIEAGIIAILGGDPGIGQTLKLMVESRGYDARFFAEPVRFDDFAPEIGLLLLAPALSVEGRKALFDAMATMPEKVPVLELVPEVSGARKNAERVVTWPCGTERLGSAIHDALSAESLTELA